MNIRRLAVLTALTAAVSTITGFAYGSITGLEVESPFKIYETYDSHPCDSTLIFNGYSWDGSSLSTSKVNVVKENEASENQVVQITLLKHDRTSKNDMSSGLLLSKMYLDNNYHVIENDIKVIDDKTSVRFHMRSNSSKEVEDIVEIKDGGLYMSSSGTKLADITINEWQTVSIILNVNSASYEIFLNGEKVGTGSFAILNTAMLTHTNADFRLTAAASPEIDTSVYLDNYRLYKGSEITSAEPPEYLLNPGINTEYEPGSMGKKLMGAVVLALDSPMVKIFNGNREIHPENRNVVPYKNGNNVMVPMRFILEAYGYSLESTEDGNILITNGDKAITFNVGENSYYSDGVTKKLSSPVELKYDRSFISAKDAADIVGKKLQITKTDLIIFSDSEQFYDEKENAFEIDMLAKLLITQKHGPRAFTEVSDEFFDEMRRKIALNKLPYKRSWESVKDNADIALEKMPKLVLYGRTGTGAFFDSALACGGVVRDAAFVWRVTGEEKYAKLAKEVLFQWVGAENPCPPNRAYMDNGYTYFDGLTVSRAFVPYLFGYSYLYPYLTEEERREVENWAQRIYVGNRYVDGRWRDADYYGQQYFQNHVMIFTMGMAIAGSVSRDLDIMYYLLEDPNNDRKMTDLIRGVIVMEGDSEICVGDPTLTQGKPAPQDGEIYDRYRMRVGKGMQYAELCSRALLYTAEIFYNCGVDYYDYYAENGENLRLPFEFYADFHMTLDLTIKGGYYTGSNQLPLSYHAVYPIVQSHYPDSFEIQNVCLNVRELVQTDGEQYGYLAALTHGQEVPRLTERELPDVKSVKINGKEFEDFRPDKTLYEIEFTPSEPTSLNVEIETDAVIQKIPDKADETQYLIYDKQNPNLRGTYKFIGILVPDTNLPEDAQIIPVKFVSASKERPGNEGYLAIDDDESSNWSVDGSNWIIFEMEEMHEVSLVTMLLNKARGRQYIFNIELSEDGENWKKVIDTRTTGKTTGKEVFRFEPTKAKYIRVNTNGFAGGVWFNLNDLRVYSQAK